MIHYLPLEHIDSRYTCHMDFDIVNYLNQENIDYNRIYPDIDVYPLKPGQFLESSTTIKFKNLQLSEISDGYYSDKILSEDVIWSSDLWFPGIESIGYLNLFHKKNIKLQGLLHAGSWTTSDSISKIERWGKYFEEMVFDISEKLFVASEFIKNDILQKRNVPADKLIVTPFPLDSKLKNYKPIAEKEDIILFTGRNHPEKQPWLFNELRTILEKKYPTYKFIWTLDSNLTKDEYYTLLNKSKYIVSFALQENFGYSIAEAVYLGVIPILPNQVVYPEFYNEAYLYTTFTQCVELLDSLMSNETKPTIAPFKINSFKQLNHQSLHNWFN